MTQRYIPMTWIMSILLIACSRAVPAPDNAGKVSEIQCPSGYEYEDMPENSFAAYLGSIALKKDNTVYLYDGARKANQHAQYAVLDIDVGNKDLQQCADAVMRLRGEWLFASKKYEEIAFHFVNGQLCEFSKYAEGYRPVFNGNRFEWKKNAGEDYSHKSFRKYMDLVFTYAGTASLIRELKKVPIADIRAGDVFIQSGNPYGHAVIVVAVAKSSSGGRKFLLAQSFMPAQDIHILRNNEGGAWYDALPGEISTPEWQFYAEDLRRW